MPWDARQIVGFAQGEGDLFMRVWWFSIKGPQQKKSRPVRRWCKFVFRLTFLTCCCFFFRKFSQQKKKERMNMKHAFRWQLLFFVFWKALATQQDQLTVFMEQLEIYQKIQRQLVCSKANEVGEPQRFRPKKHHLWRWLEGAKMCQVPFFLFFSGFFGGKFQGFLYNSTKTHVEKAKKNGGVASFSWMIWGGFWLDAIFLKTNMAKFCETWGCHG